MNFSDLYHSSADTRSNLLSDKAMLKSCEIEMAYFDVLGDKLRCHFLRIKLPIRAQTSVTRQIIVKITTECSLFGMSELYRCNGSHPKFCLHFLSMKNG